MQKILGLLLCLILISSISLAYAQFDPLEKLNTSTIQFDGQTLSLTNDIEVRQFKNSPFVKIQGETATGETVLIFLKYNNPDFQKVIIFDGQFHKGILVDKPIIAIEPEVTAEEISETKDFKIVLSQPFTNFWKTEFKLDVRVYESDMNFLNDIFYKEGYLEGLNVDVTIYDESGNVFKEFSGVTDNRGFLKEKFMIVENLTSPGEYTTVIQVSDGMKTKSHVENFFVIASVPPKGSTTIPVE